MSKKYKITGPDGEELGLHFREKEGYLMVGGRLKFKPFLDHICFRVLGLSGLDVTKEGRRQAHKYRYYFDVHPDFIKTRLYGLREKYSLEEVESIVKLS